jgi:hypothetical protein
MLGFFSDFFSSVGSFFKRAAKTAIGIFVNSMEDAAISVVKDIEQNYSEAKGTEKHEIVFNRLVAEFPDARTFVINWAIETALAIVKQEMGDDYPKANQGRS